MNLRIKRIYLETYSLFKSENSEKRFQYLRKDWIFPNHIDIMIDLVKKLSSKYKGDKETCILATILHDVGLVYKRKSSSTAGHENRSVEYAKKILNRYKYSEYEIKKVIDCIKSTYPKNRPKTINDKIVRTADALSQLTSIHFFAKATFSQSIDNYIEWLERKVKNNFKKICFKDEMDQVKLIKKYLLEAIKMHYRYNKNPKKIDKIHL